MSTKQCRPSSNLASNHVVPAADRRPSIAVRRRHRALLQQPHQLAHRVRHDHLRVALHQNIQLWVFGGAGLLALRVEAALGRDGRARGLEDLGHVGAVRDGPARLLWEVVNLERRVEGARVGSFVVNGHALPQYARVAEARRDIGHGRADAVQRVAASAGTSTGCRNLGLVHSDLAIQVDALRHAGERGRNGG